MDAESADDKGVVWQANQELNRGKTDEANKWI